MCDCNIVLLMFSEEPIVFFLLGRACVCMDFAESWGYPCSLL